MKTDEMVKTLKEKGYEIKEPENRLLAVKFSDRKNVLLEDEDESSLVETWENKKDLNDFEYFKEDDCGHFWIGGMKRKFEFRYNGKWLICDDIMDVRFLK